jgi:hypothetical protein
MIALSSDCLLFEMTSGESIPFSADMISAEMVGDSARLFDSEFLRNAAKAVFHYFKHDLGRQSVSMGEFAGALEKVLRGFALAAKAVAKISSQPGLAETDLRLLAQESGQGCELFFFPRLRDELRQQLRQGPRVLRFSGLRGAVKQLVGAQRWGARCQDLKEQIVGYLRECSSAEAGGAEFALLVE